MKKIILVSALTMIGFFDSSVLVFADIYNVATFTGAIYGGNANAQSPFNSEISSGGLISGNFLIDNNIPIQSDYYNVYFSGYPDIANIPDSVAFTINLGASDLTFTMSDANLGAAAIQYKDRAFNGFVFDSLFTYSNNQQYKFSIQGGTWSIYDPNTYQQYVSGYIDFSPTVGGSYVPEQPQSPVPVPSTMLLFGTGIAGLTAIRRRIN